MRQSLGFLVLGVILILGCNRSDRAASRAETAPSTPGKALYERLDCARCHGADGKGGPLSNYVRFPDQDFQAKPESEIRSVILDGRRGTTMLGFRADLTNTDLDALVDYLRSFAALNGD